ncbi:MAG: DNA-binding beta-propeller fold protein YncE, partial [Myxococcota bacterium]
MKNRYFATVAGVILGVTSLGSIVAGCGVDETSDPMSAPDLTPSDQPSDPGALDEPAANATRLATIQPVNMEVQTALYDPLAGQPSEPNEPNEPTEPTEPIQQPSDLAPWQAPEQLGWQVAAPTQAWPQIEHSEFPTTLPERPYPLQGAVQYPAWTSGRAMALHAGELFIASAMHDLLIVMDASTGQILRTIEVGARPEQVVVGPDGTAFVTARFSGSVVRIEAGAGEVSEAKIVGVEPFGLALTPAADRLYVSLSSEDKLVALDPQSLEVLDQWSAPGTPRGVAATAMDASVAAQHGPMRNTQAGLNEAAASPLRTSTPMSDMLMLGPPTMRSNRALAVTLHPITGTQYVAHSVSNPGDEKTLFEAALLGGLNGPNGSDCDGSPDCGGGGYGGGFFTEHPDLVRAVRTTVTAFGALSADPNATSEAPAVVDPAHGEPLEHRIDQASDINHHPTQQLLFVVGQGTDNVLVLSTASSDPMRSPLAEITVGQGPKAITFSADGATAYVLNAHSFDVSRIDLSPLMNLPIVYAQNMGKEQVAPGDSGYYTQVVSGMTHEAVASYGNDPLPEAARLGRRAFHFSRDPGLTHKGEFACATCHFEGGEDKLVWMIPEGMRQTPQLAGRLKGTGPFNWLGTEDDLGGNMANTIERMGGVGLSDAQLESLGLYMEDYLEPVPNPHLSPDG